VLEQECGRRGGPEGGGQRGREFNFGLVAAAAERPKRCAYAARPRHL
jgi:hypothetical protein